MLGLLRLALRAAIHVLSLLSAAPPDPAPAPLARERRRAPRGRAQASKAAQDAKAAPVPTTFPPAPPSPAEDLVRPYTPPPPPPAPLCISLPASWQDDPCYSLLPFAVAGASGRALSPQVGTLGRCTRAGEKIAASYNDCFAHAYFAPPGLGKTYVRGVHIENATLRTPYLNALQAPLCTVSLHCEQGRSHAPDLLASVRPNQDPAEVHGLVYEYGSLPQPLPDVLCLTLPGQVAEHRRLYPHVQTLALLFAPGDLGLSGLKHLMGFSDEDDTLQGAHFEEMIRSLPAGFGVGEIEEAIERYPFQNEGVRGTIRKRFLLCRPYLLDGAPQMRAHVRPGRTIIVDIRDGWLSAGKAMRLFGALCDALVLSGDREELPCNLLLCFDEVHKFCRHPGMRAQIEYIIRERRHLRASVLLLSQDPMSVPGVILSLLDVVGVFRTDAQKWLDYLGGQIAAFRGQRIEDFTHLPPGQMLLWSRQWWEESGAGELHGGLLQLRVRPRLSQHGGGTRTAVPAM